MKSIEELVAQVKQSTYPDWNVDIDRYLLEFAIRFLAAYTDQQEPVAWVPQFSWQRSIDAVACTSKRSFDDIPLFAAPAVPAHLCVVPREPTEAMIRASWDCAGLTSPDDGQRKYIAIAWHAMFAAGEKKSC